MPCKATMSPSPQEVTGPWPSTFLKVPTRSHLNQLCQLRSLTIAMKLHSTCNEVGLSKTAITTNASVNDFLCHRGKQRWQGCATRQLTLLITGCDDNQIVPCKNCFGQADPHGTRTTPSHATTLAISKADNIIPCNNQTFPLMLSTKSVNHRSQIN